MIIERNTVLRDLIDVSPDSLIVLANEGLAVKGCNVNVELVLADFFEHAGFDENKCDEVLGKLNKLRQVEFELVPGDEDFKAVPVEIEGKNYFKVAGMFFTDAALNNLLSVKTAEGLGIRLINGGCSGFKYAFDFYEGPQEGDRIYELHPELDLYLDDFTFARSQEAIVDFRLGLHESGLKIVNKNQRRGCSCGKSIGF